MKCNNCNKEIIGNRNYCDYCGECLVDESNTIINIDTTASDEMNSKQIKEAKELLKKNKLIIAIAAVVVILAIGAVFIFGYIKSRPLSDAEIEKSIIGQTISIQGKNIKLTDKVLSEVKIVKRTTEKKYRDNIMLELELNYKDTKIYLDYNATYIYDSNEKEWKSSNLYLDSLTKIETKDKLDKIIEDEIKEYETINNSYDYYTKVYGYQISELSNITYEGEAQDREFTAEIKLSNGVYTTAGEIEGSAYFDFSTMKWDVNNVSITDISEAKENKEVDNDLLLKVTKQYLREEYADYKYMVGEDEETIGLYINNDMISELKINNYTEKKSSNQLRLEITGKANSGVVKNIEFTGVIMIPLKIGEDSSTDSEIELTKIEIEAPDLELIKDGILDKEVDDNKIKLADAETFVETSRHDQYLDNVYVNGTITLNGESKVVQVRVSLDKSDSNEMIWEVYSIADEESYSFRKFE